ncbi:MFS transporter [Frankia sp. R82]|uniref:MFS transporter n=1 Tax=Frankia sp. R82 TaxID=2950553 RepID=UPI002042C9DB|nr:MFS transporter [Frankia sp. R82]MCM3886697.1 MFS transporter [Frankia sp. R82]
MSTDTNAPTGSASSPLADQQQAPQVRRRWWVLAVVSVAQLMLVLDATIVNVMLPQVHDALHLSTTGQQWVMSIYVLPFGGLMLLGGRLTDVVGRRRVLLTGLVLFISGSLLAGTATTATQLLIARAMQGIGAAAASPAALSIVVTSFPDQTERTKALGTWGSVLGIGASMGALLGGLLVQIDWRWAFYINLPVGLAVIGAVAGLVAGGGPDRRRPPSDLGGALTITGGLLLLVYGIVSSTMNGWTSWQTVGAFAVSVVLLAAFVRIEQRHRAPLVPLRLFGKRNVIAASLGQLVSAGIMLPTFFLLPQYMQGVLHYSPLQTGLAYIPTSLAMLFVSGVVARVIPKTGARGPFLVGTVLLAGMLGLIVNATIDSGYWTLLLPVTALLGIGLVICMITIPVVGTADATEEDAGTTSGILNAAAEVGGALGLAVVATSVGARSAELVGQGVDPVHALNSGLQRGFAVLFVWVGLNLLIGLLGLRGNAASRLRAD